MIKNIIKKIIGPIKDKRKIAEQGSNTVLYYPAFTEKDKLTSHYYRAKWYLPYKSGKCEEVIMLKKGDIEVGPVPEYMCSDFLESEHISVMNSYIEYTKKIFKSKFILSWDGNHNRLSLKLLKAFGFTVLNVCTTDEDSIEYGVYAGLQWKYFLSKMEQEILIQKSYNNFMEFYNNKNETEYKAACVFGTGPSLETAHDYDFKNIFTVGCNSIAGNDKLVSHIDLDVICAGDVVSHFGVSKYAETFRAKLKKLLSSRNTVLVTTSTFGYTIYNVMPELSDKIILVNQNSNEPIKDLREQFGLPKLDSTLNIHMLPVANSMCNKVFILGCDGKSKTQDNEDFWAHAKSAQYHDLVDTGHICHPTFDTNRQKSTYSRHLDSVQTSIDYAEGKYGKLYNTLNQSNINALASKRVKYDKEMNLSKLSNKLELKRRLDDEKPLLTSGVKITKNEKSMILEGWKLSSEFVSINVLMNDQFIGYATQGYPRPDVMKKHSDYDNPYAGYKFIFDRLINDDDNIIIEFVSRDSVIERKNVKIS